MESCIATSPLLLPVSRKIQSQLHVNSTRPNIVGLPPLPYNTRKGELQISTSQSSSRRIRCAAAATATQTTTRKGQTNTISSVKDPKLDNSGPSPPGGDEPGNGGNGGGGGKFSGGLALLGVLGILDVLKDVESNWRKKDKRPSYMEMELEN